ncbi:hypothetical protein PoB_006188000 [Plakobranchus ocellatus]|uniref:Uncharacterized protein n=1 Tax=Plakobranchus ocellatus TaxID=259542 RepID=A0AAV4CUA1_9GAST|nr:hypothetical protein PoB_006188000 [Plakobranchus ocellatus]
MALLPPSTVLSKINVCLCVMALTLYGVGALITQWITAEFIIPAMLPKIPVPLNVDVHMGLLESCRKTTAMGQVQSDTCSAEGGDYDDDGSGGGGDYDDDDDDDVHGGGGVDHDDDDDDDDVDGGGGGDHDDNDNGSISITQFLRGTDVLEE